jgi:hypothetical protein
MSQLTSNEARLRLNPALMANIFAASASAAKAATTSNTSSSDNNHRSEQSADRSGSEDQDMSTTGHSPAEGSADSSESPMESGKGSGDESGGGNGVDNSHRSGGVGSTSRRRKGKAYKLEQISQRLQHSGSNNKHSPSHSGSSAHDDVEVR